MFSATVNDPIAALDRMAAEGYEIWEAAVSIGMADEADMTDVLVEWAEERVQEKAQQEKAG